MSKESKILPFNLSDPKIWLKDKFKELFLKGIERDGFSSKITSLLSQYINENKTNSYEKLKLILVKKISILDTKTAAEIKRLIVFLDEIILKNKDCYIYQSTEEVRVNQWPNNQKIKS